MTALDRIEPIDSHGKGAGTRAHEVRVLILGLTCLFMMSMVEAENAFAQPMATSLIQQDIEGRSDRHLKIMAAQYEKEEAWTEAALVYEEMIKRDEGQAQLLGQRLVDIYLENRQPQQAVEWAKRIKDGTPDPVGWMADVYYRAGAHEQAIESLKHHAASTEHAGLRARRLHQLGDLYLKRGDFEHTSEVYSEVALLSLGGPYEALAFRKLCAFHEMNGSLDEQVKEWERLAAADDDESAFARRALEETRALEEAN